MARVVIIGGGLAGLTAAFRLVGHCDLVVLEAEPRLGGQIHTERSGGFVIERGAEGFVASSEAVPRLAANLGIADQLIDQSVTTSLGFDGRHLTALAAGEAARFLGFQVPRGDLGKGIRTFRRGMGSIVWALEDKLEDGVALRRSCPVLDVARAGTKLRIRLRDGTAMEGDHLIVATSASAAAKLLSPLATTAERALADAPVMSSLTVELAFQRDAVDHPLDGTGFVIASEHQQHGLRACAFTTAKFVDRAPPDKVSLRLFFRPSTEDQTALDDAAWVARAVQGLSRVLPIRGPHLQAWVSRWANSLPVFSEAHRANVSTLEGSLKEHRVQLAGSAFHGAGIDAAVRSAEETATAVRGS